MKKMKDKENYFQFEKYTISNYLICQHIAFIKRMKKIYSCVYQQNDNENSLFQYFKNDSYYVKGQGHCCLTITLCKNETCMWIEVMWVFRDK